MYVLVPSSALTDQVEPHPMIGAYGTQEWNSLTAEEREISARKMEVCLWLDKADIARFTPQWSKSWTPRSAAS